MLYSGTSWVDYNHGRSTTRSKDKPMNNAQSTTHQQQISTCPDAVQLVLDTTCWLSKSKLQIKVSSWINQSIPSIGSGCYGDERIDPDMCEWRQHATECCESSL